MNNGEILLFRDESDFGAWRNDHPFSRIYADRYKIVKDPAIKTSSAETVEYIKNIEIIANIIKINFFKKITLSFNYG